LLELVQEVSDHNYKRNGVEKAKQIQESLDYGLNSKKQGVVVLPNFLTQVK
jgi:hypothetical protein